ncbi:hypothetical protein [Obesumbacterium proteus]|uniref:hypothetical protein n=1 Tax=Obesumbacterium proteus TaxID=82983 RepID=UPI001F24364F|nr:hypothetical protein [Obesumbacterium proteus]MDN6114723.1 hypothetical protein [Enterobacterales bacterium]MDN6433611.1 hypothetical protein [Lacticaseibacillus paracasei]MCE9886108.1 hypothetical protein [Obesumbacterium proteus]MCE9918236.1 hypothetical protein [Obesumbacterium proteus]MCE9931667.1 hypothetical protein [Obesumbacterium proteus]
MTVVSSSSKLLILGTMCLLAACSSMSSKKAVNHHRAASVTTGYHNDNTPADNYIAKRSANLTGITLASTNNVCVDQFNFLREAQSDKYSKYTADYGNIGKGYRFLSVNKNIMDGDAKNVYNMMLEMKLDTLCSKVQYTGYSVVKEKIKELSSI